VHQRGAADQESHPVRPDDRPQRGVAGNADSRRPNLFRLTFRGSDGVLSDGTHEWRRIKSVDEAKGLADAARKASRDRPYRVRKQDPSAGFSTITSAGNPHWSGPFPSGGNPHYLYISGRGRPDLRETTEATPYRADSRDQRAPLAKPAGPFRFQCAGHWPRQRCRLSSLGKGSLMMQDDVPAADLEAIDVFVSLDLAAAP
jgi:hypothetical protein